MKININIKAIFGTQSKKPSKGFSELVKLSKSVNQSNPVGFYVYAHLNNSDVFYIGKGNNRRAWSKSRQYWWSWYVDKKLSGDYKVIIIRDNLTSDEAEDFEGTLISKYSLRLLNLVKPDSNMDYKALDKCNAVRQNIKAKIVEAKALEQTNLDKASKIYITCIDELNEIKKINPDRSFLGQIIDEESSHNGYSGNILLINRLTICLKKLGKLSAGHDAAVNYFNNFRKDLQLSSAKPVLKRVNLKL